MGRRKRKSSDGRRQKVELDQRKTSVSSPSRPSLGDLLHQKRQRRQITGKLLHLGLRLFDSEMKTFLGYRAAELNFRVELARKSSSFKRSLAPSLLLPSRLKMPSQNVIQFGTSFGLNPGIDGAAASPSCWLSSSDDFLAVIREVRPPSSLPPSSRMFPQADR